MPNGPAVERLEENRPGGDSRGGRQPQGAHGVRDLGGGVGRRLAGVELVPELDDDRAIGLAPEVPRQEAARLRPVRRELAGHEEPYREAVRELDRLREREADERGERDVLAALAVERPLELRIRLVEGLVVPVEAATGLCGRDQEPEENGAEQRLVLARPRSCVGLREDRCRGLAPELLDGEPRIVARAQHRLALLDEGAHEGPELVQRRPTPLDVLLERERQLDALLELAPEHDEGAEDEAAEERVQVRGAYGHASGYALRTPSPASATGARRLCAGRRGSRPRRAGPWRPSPRPRYRRTARPRGASRRPPSRARRVPRVRV